MTMQAPEVVALILLTGLTLKHLMLDWLYQPAWMRDAKGTWGALGGVAHSALHAFGSLLVIFTYAAPALALTLMLLEFTTHYHVDWLKTKVVKGAGWTPSDDPFWYAIGIDQCLHYLTYIAMVALILRGLA